MKSSMSQCLRVDDTVFENFLHSCSTETSAIQRVASVSFVTETPLLRCLVWQQKKEEYPGTE